MKLAKNCRETILSVKVRVHLSASHLLREVRPTDEQRRQDEGREKEVDDSHIDDHAVIVVHQSAGMITFNIVKLYVFSISLGIISCCLGMFDIFF